MVLPVANCDLYLKSIEKKPPDIWESLGKNIQIGALVLHTTEKNKAKDNLED